MRVDEGEGAGMKGKTPERVGTGTVFLVAGNGVANPLCMNAYLVLAACFELEFHQGIVHAFNPAFLKLAAVA